MENSTKALLIAGGILLGILTITALTVMIANSAKLQKAQYDKEDVEKLAKWNAEWEAYNKSYLYGAEVLTVVKKAQQNNSEYSNTKYHVNVTLAGVSESNIEAYLEATKTNIFSCIDIDYDKDTGRVNKMIFKSIE